MSFCPNCGNKIETASKFCSVCGSPIEETVAQPVQEPVQEPVQQNYYQAPVQQPVQQNYYQAPSYQPVYTAKPATAEVPGNVKAQGIVGMALGIGGLVLAILGLIYTFVGYGLALDSWYYEGLGFGYAVGFGIFSLPLSIVGRILGGKSADAGNPSAMCSVGSKLGLAGIIVSGVMFFIGILSLTA